MKININLQPLNNWDTGIALFGNELTKHLIDNSSCELYGCFNYVRAIKLEDLKRFSFKKTYSKIPYKFVYSRKVKKRLPIYYHTMMGNVADINLFYTYKIPRVKYKGITICTIHDLIPLKVETENKQIAIDYKDDIAYAINHSDYLITVSEASKRDIMLEFNYPDNKIAVIPNGVDFDSFNRNIEDFILSEVRIKYALPEKFILYFGGIRKHKNVSTIIKAYSILPKELRDEVALVITQGNDDLKKLVKELKLENHVFFTSFIDEVDKPAIYKLALLTVFISLYEGFGLPIIESMAAGTPVITSNISSMPEISGNAASLVNPLDIKEIAVSLEQIIRNPEIRERMISLGYKNAQKFSWSESGRKLLELFSKLIN